MLIALLAYLSEDGEDNKKQAPGAESALRAVVGGAVALPRSDSAVSSAPPAIRLRIGEWAGGGSPPTPITHE